MHREPHNRVANHEGDTCMLVSHCAAYTALQVSPLQLEFMASKGARSVRAKPIHFFFRHGTGPKVVRSGT